MARMPHPPATTVLVRAVREWSGWFVVAAGAVLCVLGWYGISGESVIEQQLPYLASATIPGAALIVAGAVLIASRPARRTEAADERIETLYGLLVADTEPADATPTEPRADAEALLAVPGGTLYHRRDCPLVADKPTAEAVDAEAIAERSLTPCPVCEPAPPAAEPDRPAAGPDHPGPDHPGPDHPGPGPGSDPGHPDLGSGPDRPDRPDRPDPDPGSGPTPPGP